jgi:dehydrogenase/reductase SDR family member 7B
LFHYFWVLFNSTMKDKVVIITGASSGIGRALAFEFGSRGCRLLITARNRSGLEATVEALKQANIEACFFIADAANEDDNRKMVDEAIRVYGRVDVLICNAGISMRALFEELDLQVFDKVIKTNFYGTVFATKYALPHIIKSKGSIVGVSSINGKRTTPARTAYSASKFAMEGFMEALRTEVMNKGVHVLCARPGFTASNIRNNALTANGKSQGESPRDEKSMMSAEVVARYIYRSVVTRRRVLTLTWTGKMAILFNKFFPGWMDKIVYRVMANEPDSPLKK